MFTGESEVIMAPYLVSSLASLFLKSGNVVIMAPYLVSSLVAWALTGVNEVTPHGTLAGGF